jgi:hypothetical protein
VIPSFSLTIKTASMKKIRFLLISQLGLMLLLCFSSPLQAINKFFNQTVSQAFPITGKITNNKGEPLSGVSIFEKSTQNGTVSKEDGRFSLNASNPMATLVLSYVGFAPQEIAVNNLAVITGSYLISGS